MTDQNPPLQREPLPGEQYPAAILPQTNDPAMQPPPSDPFAAQSPPSDPFAAQAPPAAGDPFPPPGPPPPQFAAQPREPANKPVIILAIVAAVFIAATGVLGTLFIVEQGDHERTSGELTSVREELASTKKSAAHAADELKRKTQRNDEMYPCWYVARLFIRARTEAENDRLFDSMLDEC